MQDSERPKFEESWKKAFDGAETTPPDGVWNSIELDLAAQESVVMKKKVVFYQRLAAAMILFALLMGGYSFYSLTKGRGDEVTKGRGEDVKRGGGEDVKRGGGEEVKRNDVARNEQQLIKHTEIKNTLPQEEQQVALVTPAAAEEEKPEQQDNLIKEEAAIEEKKEEVIEEEKKKEEIIEVVAAPEILEHGPEDAIVPERKNTNRENLWVALGGSAGNYTPNTPSASAPSFQASAMDKNFTNMAFTVAAPKPQPKVGASYSVGAGIGKRFGRFVVQTGVNLIKQQINYTSNYDYVTPSNTAKASMSDYATQNATLSYTNDYAVSSTMEIVSIPVQLGYMIIDRKLGWQMNAGMSNDFFLRNVIVDKTGQREKTVQSSGNESPYRAVNWSALASTELSYRIGDHYRLSFVPGARYSFNSILKSSADAGRPVVLDIGFRFRYIFE